MHSKVISKIQAQITFSNEQKTDTELSEKADLIVEVNCAEGLQQFCEENTRVTNNTIVDMLDHTEAPETMEVGKELKFTNQNKSGKTSSAINLKCQLQCIDTAAVYSAKPNALVQTNMKSHVHLQCVDDTKLLLMPMTTLYQAVALLL